MFRYPADRIPVLMMLALTGLDFYLYFTIESFWLLAGYLVLMIIPIGCMSAWNHHHQHCRTFHSVPLNRVLEISYALHTGVTTNLWVLHHVLGHHHNYLDQAKDESRWQRRDGTTMGPLEYTFNVAVTAYYRGYLVGKKFPKPYRAHLVYTILVAVLVIALTAYRPMQAIMLFIIPMVLGLLITAWATYDHHAGLVSDDDFAASYNNMNPVYNLMTGNLGYHTAHHYKQGLHWSELPQLHEKIKNKIPEELYHSTIWDIFTAAPLTRFLNRIFGFQH